MKKTFLLLLAMVVLTASASFAQEPQLIDFIGSAKVPQYVDDDLWFYGVINNNNQVDTPLAMDFDNYQYTLVITGLNMDMIDGIAKIFSGPQIAIYEEAILGGTAADINNQPTYTDGDAILVGTFVNLSHVLFSTIGSVAGSVDWVAGSKIDDFSTEERLNWTFLAGTRYTGETDETGCPIEIWDGKVEPLTPIATESGSWGSLKSRF